MRLEVIIKDGYIGGYATINLSTDVAAYQYIPDQDTSDQDEVTQI